MLDGAPLAPGARPRLADSDRTAPPGSGAARPLAVLQVIPTLETGGAERTTIDIARAIVAAGGRALVASAGGRMVDELVAVGAVHHTLPLASKNPAVLLADAGRLADLVRREGATIVHARSRAPAWPALLAARRTGVPFVTTYHGIYSEGLPLKRLYNSVMARGDAVIANSGFTADLIRERYPYAAGRLHVIHRGLAASSFGTPDAEVRGRALRQAWGIGPDLSLILHLARLTSWKGQRVLVEALARLAAGAGPDWAAVLAGDDQGRTAYREEIEALIEARGLAARVRLVGHVADVPGAAAASDLMVVPSVRPEAFGRAAVEAQAAGRPVVVSDLGAVPETVLAPPVVAEAERTGWRVPAGDPDALAAAIGAVLVLPAAERAAIGARGRAHAARHFSVALMTERTLAVYRSLLNG